MGRDFGRIFTVVEVEVELLSLWVIFSIAVFRDDQACIVGERADLGPEGRIVREALSEDILSSLQRLLGAGHLFIQEPLRQQPGVFLALGQQQICQGFQALLFGQRGPGFALGPKRAVDILQFLEGRGRFYGFADFGSESFLCLNEPPDLCFAAGQAAQVIQAFRQFPQDRFIQFTCGFLAVAGDEGMVLPSSSSLTVRST